MLPPKSFDLDSFLPSLKAILNPDNIAIALPHRVPPIHYLPTELLDAVFGFIEPLTVLDSCDRRWVCTRVCQRWRILMQARPEFWNSIDVDAALSHKIRNPTDLLALSLEHAGRSGLTVTLTGTSLNLFLPKFASSSPRITILALSNLEGDSVALLKAIQGGMPRLERITLDGVDFETSAIIEAHLRGGAGLDLSLLPLGLDLQHPPTLPVTVAGAIITHLVISDPTHLAFLELPSLSCLEILSHTTQRLETGFSHITDFLRRSNCDLVDLILTNLLLPNDLDEWVALLQLTPELEQLEVGWGYIGDGFKTAFSTVVDGMLVVLMGALAFGHLVPNLQALTIDLRFVTTIFDYSFFRPDSVVDMLDRRGIEDECNFVCSIHSNENTNVGHDSGIAVTHEVCGHWVTDFSLCGQLAYADWASK